MHMQNDNALSGVAVFMTGLIVVLAFLFIHTLLPATPVIISPPGSNCINMNGNQIEPNPELCKMSCTATTEWKHMQAHYDEVCECCKARNIDYSNTGAYQERVYVVNADGSRGEDRTCAYFPEAEGCPKVTANVSGGV